MTNHPRSTIKFDRRSGRTARRKSPSAINGEWSLARKKRYADKKREEQQETRTTDARRHIRLYLEWLRNPSIETFRAFYLSPYC